MALGGRIFGRPVSVRRTMPSWASVQVFPRFVTFLVRQCLRLCVGLVPLVWTVSIDMGASQALAQDGFGVHPLTGIPEWGPALQLTSQEMGGESRHLQVVPRSLRRNGGHSEPSGFGLSDLAAEDLFGRAQISLSEALKRIVRRNLGPLIGIHDHVAEDNGSILLSFSVAGVELCRSGVRGSADQNREITLQGQIPVVTDWTMPRGPDDWPELDLAVSQTVDTLERTMGGPVEPMGESARCYAMAQGGFKPVWRTTVAVRGYRYSVLTDDERIYGIEPEFLHASGRARVYPYDPLTTPTLVTETLTDLVGENTLSSQYFRTVVSAGRTQASSLNREYDYEVGSAEFDETAAFVNVTKHFKYLQGLGFTWYGPRPLLINPSLASIPNNARFLVPKGGAGLPTIEIGPGVEGVLRNLASDASVVSHELGHFAIYRAITKTSGESFVLHEGLADFFEAARAEDPCLGNSVCPLESPACMVRGKCLRTADNRFKYQDSSWQGFLSPTGQYSHLHGQVFSGLLWDLRKRAKGGTKAVDTLVMRAIGFLPPEAGFSDFLTQLIVTDKETNQGGHREQILQVVSERELGSFLNLDESGNPVAKVEKSGIESASNAGTASGTTPRRSKKSGGCGVLGRIEGHEESEGSSRSANFMLMVPILLVFSYSFFKKSYNR